MNVGESKVMRCSGYVNVGRMHLRLNSEPLQEVTCFEYLRSQVASDGGCERNVIHQMNDGYTAWRALKGVLTNRGLGINGKVSTCRDVAFM